MCILPDGNGEQYNASLSDVQHVVAAVIAGIGYEPWSLYRAATGSTPTHVNLFYKSPLSFVIEDSLQQDAAIDGNRTQDGFIFLTAEPR